MKPFLSITIPTYNRANCLKKVLDAVLLQVSDKPEVEVIIFDNASTDDTPGLCAEYVRKSAQVRYFRNETNTGFDGNILACVQRAGGDYVSFFSDDDLPVPGHFVAILTQLRAHRPSIMYVNHAPYFSDNPACLRTPMAPVKREMLNTGKEFYLKFGLGFISALTVHAEGARTFINKAVIGRGTAHVDIAARMALANCGPFVYDGSLVVLARYNESAYSNILRYGVMNITLLHQDLYQEGRLSEEELKVLKRAVIVHGLPRSILADRCQGTAGVKEREVRALYGGDPLYYFLAYPLLVFPAPLVRAMARPLRSVVRYWRRWYYAR
jgi:glycosyltransferase involved in cell wall biosynthesis